MNAARRPHPLPQTPDHPTPAPRRPRWLVTLLASALLGGMCVGVRAQTALPAEVASALVRARIPAEAVSLLVVDADGRTPPRLAHRTQVPMHPASVMKLVTTYAALDLLGPAFAWTTPVYADGPVANGTLQGTLYLRGQGDPKLVMERLWLLLRRVQALGIRQVAGDIVLDRSAFEPAETDPASFDGEPLRPYNASPDALLLNFKSLVLGLTPDRAGRVAQVTVEPPLAGLSWPATVPLSTGDCGDWRGGLKADFTDPARIRLAGSYPASCGERQWPVAAAEPRTYAARAVEGLWRELGGSLGGKVREGKVPAGLAPLAYTTSPGLADTIRDINKFSNNVMAQQLFLTLSLQQKGTGSLDASREVLRAWWQDRLRGATPPVVDNGSGLSRSERITAAALGQMLQQAWASPLMPELLASLPVAGVDGTLRRSRARAAQGNAHLKTGSLRDVVALAGFVHSASGRRQVLVAMVNHPDAAAARPALDALLDWAARDN